MAWLVHEAYQSLFNRNKRMKELEQQFPKSAIRVYAMRNQVMHPMYVKDYDLPLTEADKGFGNTLYNTHFPRIYIVEVRY